MLFLAIAAGAVSAQISAQLQLNKTQYIAGEPVVALLTVTNHAGRELVFHGDGRRDWLDFHVRDRNGNPVNQSKRGAFGAMRIAAGQSLQRQVNLSEYYFLNEPGNFSVAAAIRTLGGDNSVNITTNRVIFTLNPGRIYWSQKVGVPGRRNQTREYRVLQTSNNQRSQLYAQIVDDRTGLPMRTFNLGDSLSIRRPSVTVDKQQRMHVMFISTPTMWVHYIVDLEGNVVNRDIHQRGPQGDPRLVTMSDGTVLVSNSIPYDPAAAAAARARIRNISDRPNIVYE